MLTVPAGLGNEYAYRVGEVDWVFTVEGFNNEKPLIPTGQLNWPVAVFGALGVLLIAGGVVVLTKKKKHDEAETNRDRLIDSGSSAGDRRTAPVFP